MRAYESPCRVCGARIVGFDLPVDDPEIRVVTRCAACGAENAFRTQICTRPESDDDDKGAQQIDRLVSAADWLLLPIFLSFYVCPLVMLWKPPAFLVALEARARDGSWIPISLGTAVIFYTGALVGGPAVLIRYLLLRRATRLSTLRNTRLARQETKPPILLLRSFFKGALARHARVYDSWSN